MRVLIIEDNISTALDIELIFNDLGDWEVTHAVSIEESEKLFRETKPELIVADILLEGTSSLSFLSKEVSNVPIIILTNNYTSEYYEESLAMNAQAYLMKPINAVSLKFEVDRLFQNKDIDQNSSTEKMMIKDGQKIHLISPNDIIWIVTEGNYSTIKTTNKKIIIKKSLAKITCELPPDTLFKSHRSAMISIHKIDSLDLKANIVIMKDGTPVPLSKNYRTALSEILGKRYRQLT